MCRLQQVFYLYRWATVLFLEQETSDAEKMPGVSEDQKNNDKPAGSRNTDLPELLPLPNSVGAVLGQSF